MRGMDDVAMKPMDYVFVMLDLLALPATRAAAMKSTLTSMERNCAFIMLTLKHVQLEPSPHAAPNSQVPFAPDSSSITLTSPADAIAWKDGGELSVAILVRASTALMELVQRVEDSDLVTLSPVSVSATIVRCTFSAPTIPNFQQTEGQPFIQTKLVLLEVVRLANTLVMLLVTKVLTTTAACV
mgnify:CR=1 FL=1